MKKIINYLKAHLKEDFNMLLYGYFVAFLIVSTTLNYQYKFEQTVLDGYFGTPLGIILHICFYFFAYYAIAVPQAFILDKRNRLTQLEFWVKSLVFVGLIGLVDGFYQYRYLVNDLTITNLERNFLYKVIGEFKRVAIYTLPILLIYWIFDKKEHNLYGFTRKKFDHKPYVIMLLIMLPLIATASFESSFIKAYPRFKPWLYPNIFELPAYITTTIFEFAYGLDFIFVEWIFRGTLIIGLVRVMGKDAILPMVATYAYLHFGKPLGETIGSVFGGYILGVIALQTKNIAGGIYIHMGVAYLMEFFAFIQHYFFKD